MYNYLLHTMTLFLCCVITYQRPTFNNGVAKSPLYLERKEILQPIVLCQYIYLAYTRPTLSA